MSLHRLAFLLQILFFVPGQTRLKDIYILGLFPMDGDYAGGKGIKPAVDVTMSYVNSDSNVLPGYRLNMKWNDTKCHAGYGIKILAYRMCSSTTFIMILGDGCSSVCKVMASVSHVWNLVQVSYSASSLALSDDEKFPFFFRVVPSEKQLNYARVALVKYFKWTKVVAVYQTKAVFVELIHNIEEMLKLENITIIAKFELSENPKSQVLDLKEADARIIIAAFFEDVARNFFCEAFKIRFSGPRIVWVMPSFYLINWWKINDTDCTGNEILSTVGDYLSVDPYIKSDFAYQDDNGITLKQFMDDYNVKTNNTIYPGALLALAGYDSVWVIARALNATLADLKNTGLGLESFSYTNNDMGILLKNNMKKVKFNSLSGHVSFYENGDSTNVMTLEQFQDGKLVTFGWYNALADKGKKLTWNKSVIVRWVNGMVPWDSVQTRMFTSSVIMPLYISMCVFAGIGILLSVFFLAFNIKFKTARIINMSSPNINNLILFGCITVYTYVFVHGLDISQFPIACQAKGYLIVIGFSLVFGSLFAKTWRVYVIFIASKKLRRRAPKDVHLLMKIGAYSALNAGIVVLWTVADPSYPLKKQLDHQKVYDEVNDVFEIPVIWSCTSEYFRHFNVVLLGIQLILLLFGAFLTFTTRKVNTPVLNDSKAIGMCIYNVIVLAAVALLFSEILEDDINIAYGINCILIIGGTTVTQCLIFIPKMLQSKDYILGDEGQTCASPATSKYTTRTMTCNITSKNV
ncbi:gamma-aminobutyric acid type B receptor subunit 1-like [Gigantopelta aegis]|uniref:gamma-aminobutyric acid type B receptor subunit 1-like n=1 Tax=Gigantopelta aegis TaxID=1735272 RepID=UPI001B887795|nr:gamma-aminobutyric acid type B receptor subunit 1-like [Gigantopelta aegis]XP_041352641.1 gamma-aminobutyric acid type B receptor subunit 1-like [Gigantopelta aegis]